MNKKGILIEIVVIVIFLIIGFFWFTANAGLDNGLEENQTLKDALKEYGKEGVCVPATCCHPTECVSLNDAPNCSDVMCTMNCQPNTMDCGQGECKFIDGKCQIIWNEE